MTAATERHEPDRVRIPADVYRPDRILAGLTTRQLALLVLPAVALWAAYLATHQVVALPVFIAAATPIAVAAVVLATGRRDGVSLDRLLLAAIRQARTPHVMVPAPEGIEPAPPWAGHDPHPAPAPLRLPARGVADDGAVHLDDQGTALICRASTVGFGLRTPAEQRALAGAFGRYLNSLQSPVQILVRSQPVDLGAAVAALREQAGGLPHPALEAAALAHATFLEELAATRTLLARQVLVVLRDPAGGPDAGNRLRRRAEEAAAALGAAGISLSTLDGEQASACLRAAADPWSPPGPAGLGSLDAVVSGSGAPDPDVLEGGVQ